MASLTGHDFEKTATQLAFSCGVPNIPGFRPSNQHQPRRKRQVFGIVGGMTVENPPREGDHLCMSTRAGATLTTTGNATIGVKGRSTCNAGFIENDRKVLRFYCFFREAVHESPNESTRVHRCVIMYYLEDNTLHVTEPREENSGFPQGTFLRRGKVYKRDGVTLISPADFVVGEFVEFYGRRYVIVDCDAFSRSWFKERGIEQPEAISYPEDRYCKQLEERKVREGRDTSVNYGKLLNPNKVYMEARLGKFSHDSNKASQFFANDRKVLRFYCVWNEAVEIFGIKQYYKLNYFLADDTVEVRETQDPNCGKDPFACLLRRQKLPRRWEEEMSRAREGLDASGDAYVKAVELRVGGMVNVYGRQLEIYDADEFTREYFRTEIGVELAPALPRPCPSEQRPSSPPPFNGFGSEEDSLQNALHLVPKPPKKDFIKLMKNDVKVLRYASRFDESVPGAEEDRRFVIYFHLADDTIHIHEPPKTNSGILGGKFLQRGKYKKDITSYFVEEDFFAGARIVINGFRMVIERPDDYTILYMGQKGNALFDIVAVRSHLKQIVESGFDIESSLGSVSSNGHLTRELLHEALESCGLHPQELITLDHEFTDKQNDIWVQDLLEFVFGPDELVNTKARAHRVLRKLQRDISSVRDEVENILTERGNATEGVIDRNTCRTALCDTIARDRLSVDTSDYTDADIDALVSVLFRGGVDVMAIQVIMTLLFGLEDSVVTGRRSGQL